jgi:hypothetical protein
VSWFCLLIMTSGAFSGLPARLVSCGFLYVTTELLSVFSQDYSRNPATQTAVPWLLYTVLYRLPVWHYMGWVAYSEECAFLLPVVFGLIALDCAACQAMYRWLDEKHRAASAGTVITRTSSQLLLL